MSVTGDFPAWDFLHGLIDCIEPPFGFVGARHVSFVCRDDGESITVTG